jgi:O-antigen/teichoic acid export membrane protein
MSGLSQQGVRVTRNLILTAVGEVVGASLNILVIVVIARYLEVERFGQYAFIMAVVGIFQLLASAGFGQILVREIAVNASQARRYVGAAKAFTWILSLATFAVIAIVVQVTTSAPDVRLAAYVAAIGVIATVHAACYAAVFRAFEEMEVNATGFVLHKIVFLALALVGVRLDSGLLGMCAAAFLANGFLWVYYLAVLEVRHFHPRLQVDLPLWKELLRDSLPLGVTVILRRISLHVDVLILTFFGMTAGAGYFSAAYKLIQALTLIPFTLAQVLLPVFSRMARSDDRAFREAFERTFKFLLFLAFPLTLGLGLLAGPLVGLVYGPSFAPAASSLAIMSLCLLFLFPTSLCLFVFTAMGAQRLYTIGTVIYVAVNIAVDFALVPAWEQVGASIGTLTAEIVLFAASIFFLRRLEKPLPLVRLTWRPLLAGAAMSAVLLALRGTGLVAIIVAAAAGVALYVVALLALRAVSPAERALLLAATRVRLRPASSSPR